MFKFLMGVIFFVLFLKYYEEINPIILNDNLLDILIDWLKNLKSALKNWNNKCLS